MEKPMKAILEYIQNLFSDSSKVSMMRTMTFFVVVNVMIMWDYYCIKTGNFIDMGWSNAAAITGTVIGKAIQRFSEYDEETDKEDTG